MIKRLLITFVLILSLLFNINAVDEWTTLTPHPYQHYGSGTGCYDNTVYVFGGYDGTQYFSSAYKYDISTDTWTAITPLPLENSRVGFTTIENNIYLIGGYTGTTNSRVYSYNTLTDTYIALTSYPINIMELGCTNDKNNNIYCFGGNTGTVITSNAYKYDTTTNTWTAIAPLPIGLRAPTVAYDSDKQVIYISGGWTGSTYSSTIYEYDISSNTYTAISNLLVARYRSISFYHDNTYWNMLGSNANGISAINEIYDLSTDTHSYGTPAPTGLTMSSYCDYNGKVYIIGGFDGTNYVNSNYMYYAYDTITAPIITPITPVDNQTFTFDVPSIDLEITTDISSVCMFDDGTGNVSMIPSADNLTHTYTGYLLGDATTYVKNFTITYYCADTTNTSLVGEKTITFHQDQVPLALEIYVPQDQQHFDYNTQVITFHIETNYVSNCEYLVYNMSNFLPFEQTGEIVHKTNYTTFYPDVNEYPTTFLCAGVYLNETINMSVTFYIDEEVLKYGDINQVTIDSFSVIGTVTRGVTDLSISIVPITIVTAMVVIFLFVIYGLTKNIKSSIKLK